MTSRGSLRVAALLFLGSGFAALVYQVIWQRILGIFSGLHIYSVTLIVTAFMAGLGFGSLYGGRLADRFSRATAVLAFAVCEAVIGAFALISPWLYYDVAYLRLGFLVQYPMVLPVVHLLLLLLPTFLMGASLPLLSRALVFGTEGAARTIGLLYGFNTLGAAVGALVSAWFLIGRFGFVGTIRIGAALNVLVALGALVIYRQVRGYSAAAEGEQLPDTTPSAAVSGGDAPGFGLRQWCLIYALSGFVALSLELMWFRVIDVAVKSSPYTFGHLLGLFLGFLALGSLCGIFWVPRLKRPELAFLWGQWGVSATAGAALLLACYGGLGALGLGELTTYWGEQVGLEMVELVQALAGETVASGKPVVLRFVQAYLVMPLILLALPTFLMGFTFTCVQRAVQTDAAQVGFRVGAIQTANIVGSILGSLVTGTLFLRWLGTAQTASLLIAAGTVFALLAMLRMRGNARHAMLGLVGLSVILALAVPRPDRFWRAFHGAGDTQLIVDEDASGVAAIQELGTSFASMRVNGKMHSKLPYGDEHSLLGLLPALMHPDPKQVLVIGLGTGNTAWAAAASPHTERLDVYEIVAPEITVLRTQQANAAVNQLLNDPRVHLRFSDGRLALRTEERRYDVIEADALDPSMSYSGNLYSREFYELSRSRLADGGVLCGYIPTERTRRTVAGVFPYLLDFHTRDFASFVIASNEPMTFDRELVRRRLHAPEVQRYLQESGELQRTTRLVERFLDQVSVTAIDDTNRNRYVDGDINTDLFPRDEFDKTYDGTYQ